MTQADSGKTDQALSLLEQTQSLCELLVAADERDPAALNQMAWLHHSLANAHFKRKQITEARVEYQRAIEWRERAMQIAPELQQIRTSLAESQLNLAQCSVQLGETAASREQFRSAIAVLDEALAQGNSDLTLSTSRGVAYLNLSNVDAAIDGAATAVESCNEGIESVRAVYNVEPSNLVVRDTLFRLLGNRGMYRMQSEQAAPAVADWREAIQLATDPASREYCQTMLIRCLTLDRQFEAAEQEAESCRGAMTSAQNRFRLAAAWGNLSEATREHDAELSTRCGERCLAETRTLVTVGSTAEIAVYQPLIESLPDFRAVRESTHADERSSWFADPGASR